MKKETLFRTKYVEPFLDALPNTHHMSIQQTSRRGDPDKILCVNGLFVAMELKAEDKRPTKLQGYVLKQVDRAGGIALSVNETNWEDTKLFLSRLSATL